MSLHLPRLSPAVHPAGSASGESGQVRQFKSRADYYDKRRKTTFGQTLRRDLRGESTTEKKVPRIFKLVLESSSQLVDAPNEAVRVILPLRLVLL